MLADRFREVVRDLGINIMLPQDGNLTSMVRSLVDSDVFKTISDKFT
jgi:hypothetical protein